MGDVKSEFAIIAGQAPGQGVEHANAWHDDWSKDDAAFTAPLNRTLGREAVIEIGGSRVREA